MWNEWQPLVRAMYVTVQGVGEGDRRGVVVAWIDSLVGRCGVAVAIIGGWRGLGVLWVWWRVVVGVVWSGWLLSLVCAARGDSRGLLRVGGLWLHCVCLRGRVGRGLVYSGGLLRRGWWLVLVSRPIGLDARNMARSPSWLAALSWPVLGGGGSGRAVSLAVEVSPTWAILVTWFGVVSPPWRCHCFHCHLPFLLATRWDPCPASASVLFCAGSAASLSCGVSAAAVGSVAAAAAASCSLLCVVLALCCGVALVPAASGGGWLSTPAGCCCNVAGGVGWCGGGCEWIGSWRWWVSSLCGEWEGGGARVQCSRSRERLPTVCGALLLCAGCSCCWSAVAVCLLSPGRGELC